MTSMQSPIIRIALVTVAALLTYRLGSNLHLPGVDVSRLGATSGGSISRLSLLALGMMPWLSALIIFECVILLLPSTLVSRLGLNRINKPFSLWVVAVALIFAAVQSYGVAVALTHMRGLVSEPGSEFLLMTCASLVGGTALMIALGYIIEMRGVGNGFWVLLAGSMLANVPSNAEHLYALASQGQFSFTAGAVSLAVDIAVIATVIAVLEARRLSGLQSAEPIVWPMIIAPLAVGWVMALAIAIWPGGPFVQPGALDFFLVNHPIAIVIQAVIAGMLAWRYAKREAGLGFFLPIAGVTIGAAILSKLSLTSLHVPSLLGAPAAVVVATVCYVVIRRADSLGISLEARQ